MTATTTQISDEEIVAAFWDAVPDAATLDDFADGIDVTFSVGGRSFTINTRVVARPRTTPLEHYGAKVEAVAIAVVRQS